MAKGSQLSQLKSALSQAGVTGKPQQSRKRKRSGSVDKDKEKRAAKLEEIHRKLNPFDTKVTKLKHDVGGRKIKGVVGKPAQSKQAGIEQRKKTLLKEFHEKGRAGGIVDRRFGENDPTMTLEERMLERFTKERQRVSKGTAFNLEDEDELTHYGQSLSKLDDFDDVGLDLDDDEEDRGQIDNEIVKRTHFGGFDDDEEEDESEEPARKKSKAEVMAEVMAKSKEHKLRRQMEREQEENVRHELDQDFDALRDLIYAPDPSTTGSNSIALGQRLPEGSSKTDVLTISAGSGDYDQHVRELAFDKRAKPKDRRKTEEELALEEKEALEQAERRRRKRMLGLDESDSEDEGRSRGKRKRGGDDLEDDFVDDDDWDGLGAGLSGAAPDVDEARDSGSEEAEGDSEKGSEESSEEGSDENDSEDSENDAGEGEHEELIRSRKAMPRKLSTTGKANELPFTFPCPSTHEEFLEIVDNVDDADVPTVIKRICALYHTSLGPDNKFKLQTLTTILIDHALYVTSISEPRFLLVSSLLPHIHALTQAYPIQAADYFVEKLSLMHKNLKRGLSGGALDPGARTWPGLSELCLLRIIGSTWSTSDLSHAVISPTRVLMGAYLGLGRVRSLADISSGLFLCTLFHQFEKLSQRLVPEAVNFLVNTVLHIAPHSYKTVASLPGYFPSPDFRSDLSRPLALNIKTRSTTTPQKANLTALLSADRPTEQAKTDLLSLALNLLGKYAEMYKSLDGFVELYDPILEIIKHINTSDLAESLNAQVAGLSDTLGRLLKFSHQSRQPLRLQAHKPIPIATYIPKFEAITSSYLRRQDPDHERNEASKLRNQYKQERKGAIRELRKDAKFLAGVEQQKQKEKDRAYNDRMKRVFGSIEGERAEEKAMEREKQKEKRRAGRK